MSTSISDLSVSLFFIHATVGLAIVSWWFLSQKKATLKNFGWGLLGYTLGMAAWTSVVLVKPADLKPLILVGVVPFLLGNLMFAKVASSKIDSKAGYLIGLVVALIVATFIARTFFYPSDPYISEKGLLFFGLASVPVALYIATISVSFLPAIKVASSEIKEKSIKTIMTTGLTVLYVNAIILVSAKDQTLLLINGVVISLAVLILWVKVLGSIKKA
jgi:hypothetical protein